MFKFLIYFLSFGLFFKPKIGDVYQLFNSMGKSEVYYTIVSVDRYKVGFKTTWSVLEEVHLYPSETIFMLYFIYKKVNHDN